MVEKKSIDEKKKINLSTCKSRGTLSEETEET
jgi:hypothetical protein